MDIALAQNNEARIQSVNTTPYILASRSLIDVQVIDEFLLMSVTSTWLSLQDENKHLTDQLYNCQSFNLINSIWFDVTNR
jgi:hypothetical protein